LATDPEARLRFPPGFSEKYGSGTGFSFTQFIIHNPVNSVNCDKGHHFYCLKCNQNLNWKTTNKRANLTIIGRSNICLRPQAFLASDPTVILRHTSRFSCLRPHDSLASDQRLSCLRSNGSLASGLTVILYQTSGFSCLRSQGSLASDQRISCLRANGSIASDLKVHLKVLLPQTSWFSCLKPHVFLASDLTVLLPQTSKLFCLKPQSSVASDLSVLLTVSIPKFICLHNHLQN
jgi:hypothetical protein